jgi:mono/diheme cytochrome c family protein
VFAANCGVCHGPTGEGDYGPNLHESTLSLAEIVEVVTFGREPMESFQDLLTAAEIEAVARFVERLQG